MPALEQYDSWNETYKRDQAIDDQTPLDAVLLQSDPGDV
jgi:hypothetical protein